MKLTAEQIAKIEAVLTTVEEDGQRAAVIKYNLSELGVISGFCCFMRREIGVPVKRASQSRALTNAERVAVAEFIRKREAASNAR